MKDIPGYKGRYAITSCGKVWSYKNNKFLKPCSNKFGYYFVNFYKDGKKYPKYIHRMIAEIYIPNPNNYPEVNHIDEIKSHNWKNNLEWCTSKYNCNHGTRNQRIGIHGKKVQCVETDEIDFIQNFANKLKVHNGSIHASLIKGTSCKGYHFKNI